MRSGTWSLKTWIVAIPCLVLAVGSVPAQEASPAPSPAPTSSASGLRSARLFLNFIEDATIVHRQWWEGQVEYSDSDPIDSILVRGIVAFQPIPSLEFGGRVGFGSTDTPAGIPEGTGATDLDAWGKYYFATPAGATEFAAGGIATIPTGDDTAGLGYDAFSVGAFGSIRYNAKRFTLTGKVGIRMNGDGSILGSPEANGDTSASAGAGVIWPWTNRLSFVGEANYEDGRFEGADSDSRALGGIHWQLADQGTLRAAVGFGLSDEAPDLQLIVGYAASF